MSTQSIPTPSLAPPAENKQKKHKLRMVRRRRNHPKLVRDVRRLPRSVDKNGNLKKKRRFRSGTVAMREIRSYQGGPLKTVTLIRKKPLYRVIKETMQNIRGDYRLTAGAFDAIQQQLEGEMVKVFEATQAIACHSKRETITPEDMQLVNIVRTIYPGKPDKPFDQRKLYFFRSGGPIKRTPFRSTRVGGGIRKPKKIVKPSSPVSNLSEKEKEEERVEEEKILTMVGNYLKNGEVEMKNKAVDEEEEEEEEDGKISFSFPSSSTTTTSTTEESDSSVGD
jgi:histone H3